MGTSDQWWVRSVAGGVGRWSHDVTHSDWSGGPVSFGLQVPGEPGHCGTPMWNRSGKCRKLWCDYLRRSVLILSVQEKYLPGNRFMFLFRKRGNKLSSGAGVTGCIVVKTKLREQFYVHACLTWLTRVDGIKLSRLQFLHDTSVERLLNILLSLSLQDLQTEVIFYCSY